MHILEGAVYTGGQRNQGTMINCGVSSPQAPPPVIRIQGVTFSLFHVAQTSFQLAF